MLLPPLARSGLDKKKSRKKKERSEQIYPIAISFFNN